jgi:protease-4
MALFTQQLLRERRADRRWRVFFRLAWLILFIIVAWSLFVGRGHWRCPSGPHTALIECAERSRRTARPALKTGGRPEGAFEDAESQAVVLRINSPGGSRCRQASSTTRSGA